MFRVFLVVFLLTISGLSFSDPGDWTPFVKLSHLFIEGGETSPRATLKFETNVSDSYKPSSCLSHYITVDLSTEKGKQIYSLVLAARMADKPIRVTLPNCHGSRPLVYQVNL